LCPLLDCESPSRSLLFFQTARPRDYFRSRDDGYPFHHPTLFPQEGKSAKGLSFEPPSSFFPPLSLPSPPFPKPLNSLAGHLACVDPIQPLRVPPVQTPPRLSFPTKNDFWTSVPFLMISGFRSKIPHQSSRDGIYFRAILAKTRRTALSIL